jgi:hypothetical protein
MFSVTKNIYNKKTKGSTLMELFTATGNLDFLEGGQLEMCAVSPMVMNTTNISSWQDKTKKE